MSKIITDMRGINLKKIIEDKGLKPTDVGRALYPKVLQPYQAIKRAIDGDTLLNTVQVVKLSELTGMTIAELFTEY